jgi:hypothetical protein
LTPRKGSPLRVELLEDVLRGEVQVDRRCLEVVVAEEALEGREADALLHGGHGVGVAEGVGRDALAVRGPADAGAVRDAVTMRWIVFGWTSKAPWSAK